MREFRSIKIYDDIKELNIKRFNEFTKYVTQAYHVNGNTSGIIAKLSTAIAQAGKDIDKVKMLLDNAFIDLEFFKANINIYAYAFAVLTDKNYSDMSMDYLKDRLFSFYVKGVNAEDMINEVKQSDLYIQEQFKQYSFSERSTATFTAKVVKRVLAMYDYKFNPKKRDKALSDIIECNNFFLDRQKIPNFNPNKKQEETNIIDLGYERNKIALQRLLNAKDIDNKTVYEYYCLVDEAKNLTKKN